MVSNMSDEILNISNREQHLGAICPALFVAIANQQPLSTQNVLLSALSEMYNACQQAEPSALNRAISFKLTEQSVDEIVHRIEKYLADNCPSFKPLKQSISYLLDELICNMQQHAKAEFGLAYVSYNTDTKTIDIALADNGITIYGSYVNTNKYLNIIGESDAQALGLAQEGYSTKDLPDAENRGYGLSSNIKMVTEGLHGEFAIISGNAMSLFTSKKKKLLSLPDQIEWNGTAVIARIPIEIPQTYNFYNYIA